MIELQRVPNAFPRRTAANHSEGFMTELGVAHGRTDRLPPRRTEPRGGGQGASSPPRPTSSISPSGLRLNPYRQDEHRWVPDPRPSAGSEKSTGKNTEK